MVTEKKPPEKRKNPFLDRPDLITDLVFLIGNGASRKDFDLERLRGKGTIIGCNALYRTFKPDLLVAIDAKMITELHKNNYGVNNSCIVPGHRNAPLKGAIRWKAERFNTSGGYAMQFISRLMKPKKCYMLGMDSYPGNMYAGSLNYNANTLRTFDNVGESYLRALEFKDTNTTFINVNPKDKWPKKCHDTGKYQHITYEEFEKLLQEKTML